MRTTFAKVLVLAAVLLGFSAGGSGAANSHAVPLLGAVPHAGGLHTARTLAAVKAAGSLDLSYHDTWVMRKNTTYAIYWLPAGSSVASGYQSGIDQFFKDVAAASGSHSNVYSVASQYYDTTGSIAYDSTFGGSYVDTSAFPASGCNDLVDSVCLTDQQMQAEIQKVITAKQWPDGQSSLFFLMLPNGVGACYDGTAQQCTTQSFCAYHSGFYGSDNQPVVYAIQPYVATIDGCNVTPGTPNGLPVDAAVNTISHEHNEAITDPWGDGVSSGGWFNANGDEIADICAWTFGSSIGTTGGQAYNQLINGHPYALQEEYSNEGSACVQHYDSRQVPVNLAPPVVTGVAAVGRVLSTSTGGWTGSPTKYSYAWQRCATDGTACTAIAGAAAATYRLAAADAGHVVRAVLSATNANGTSDTASSSATEVVVPLPATTQAPAVSGVPAVGRTLSTTTGTWNTPATSFAYRWLRCNAAGGSCTVIAGATSSTYRLTAADAGHTVAARVSATNDAGTTAALSGHTAVVIARPAVAKAPRIHGRPVVGKRLSATTGSWRGAPAAYRYQWLRCNAKGRSCVRIRGAIRRVYAPGRRDEHHRLRVRVVAVNAAGKTSASSAATRAVRR